MPDGGGVGAIRNARVRHVTLWPVALTCLMNLTSGGLVMRDDQSQTKTPGYSCWSTTTGAIVAALIAGRRVASSAALPSTTIVPR